MLANVALWLFLLCKEIVDVDFRHDHTMSNNVASMCCECAFEFFFISYLYFRDMVHTLTSMYQFTITYFYDNLVLETKYYL